MSLENQLEHLLPGPGFDTQSEIANQDPDCLLCGANDCSYQITAQNQKKWTLDFLRLFNVDCNSETGLAQNTVTVQLVQNGFYCLDCLAEIRSVSGFYKTIDDVSCQLKLIQIQCELKLRTCLNSLQAPFDLIYRRKHHLLKCMQKRPSPYQSQTDRESVKISNQSSNPAYGLSFPVSGHGQAQAQCQIEDPLFQAENEQEEDEHENFDNVETGELSPENILSFDFDPGESQEDKNGVLPSNFKVENDSDLEGDGIDNDNEADAGTGFGIPQTYPSHSVQNCENYLELKAQYKLKDVSVKVDRIALPQKYSTTNSVGSKTRRFPSNRRISPRQQQQSRRHRQFQSDQHHRERKRLVFSKSFKLKYWEEASGDLPFPCTYTDCKLSYNLESQREEHVKRFHEGLDFPFTCDTCKKPSYSYEKLRQHQNIHLGLTPYECPDPSCLKKFPTRFMLTTHMQRAKIHRNSNFETEVKRRPRKRLPSRIPMKKEQPTATEPGKPLKPKRIRKTLNTPYLYQCSVENCTKQYQTEHALEGHVKIVHEKSIAFPFPCHLCHKPMYSYEKLHQHGNVHAGLTPYECADPKCKKKFATEQLLSFHRRRHRLQQAKLAKNRAHVVGGGNDPESEPGKELGTNNAADADSQSKTGGESGSEFEPHGSDDSDFETAKRKKRRRSNPHLRIKCSEPNCSKIFRSRIQFKSHFQKAHQLNLEYPFNCPICQKPCYSIRKFSQHKNIHAGLTPFSCPETDCPEKFATETQLRAHQRRKHNSNQYVCEFCGKAFKTIAFYKLHVKNHENEANPNNSSGGLAQAAQALQLQENLSEPGLIGGVYHCDLCGKTYGSTNTYKAHMIIHDESKIGELKCQHCARIFSSKHYLKVHEQRVHTGNFRFKCQVAGCDFGGPDMCVIRHHLSTVHSDARPFECSVCQHTFKTLYYMNRHKALVHPVSKDHLCTVCGKGFANKRYLQEHEETHKEVKSFLCPHCARYFTQRTRLNIHLKSVHGIGEYSGKAGSRSQSGSGTGSGRKSAVAKAEGVSAAEVVAVVVEASGGVIFEIPSSNMDDSDAPGVGGENSENIIDIPPSTAIFPMDGDPDMAFF